VPVLHAAALAAHVWFGQTTWLGVQPQTPELQTWVEPQAWPQVPQFEPLLLVSTQALLQRVWPIGQPHWPPLQLRPVEHTMPQVPQFVWLVARSTQDWPHTARPVEQLDEQVPWLQTWLPLHTLAHDPQCAASDATSTQAPLHAMRPDLH
jgi:hypothetical protein